jgi:hypothetical protein
MRAGAIAVASQLERGAIEDGYASGWMRTIWADMLA